MGKSPAFLSWPHAGPWEDYSEQELCCEHCSGGSASPLAGLFCHCSSHELSAALREPVHERVCVCVHKNPS